MERHWFSLNILFVLLYIPIAELGMWLAVEPGNVTPLYPAAGVAFACYLLLGKSILPGIFLGGMLANFISMPIQQFLLSSIFAAFFIGLGEMFSSLLAGWVLVRLTSVTDSIQKPKSLIYLFIVCFLWIISPTIGVSALSFAGLSPWENYTFLWLTWWLGDALGIIFVVPAVLVVNALVKKQLSIPLLKPFRVSYFLVYIAFIVILALTQQPVIYLLVPATLAWVSRHYYIGALISSLLPYLVLLSLHLIGYGFYSTLENPNGLMFLQLLLGVNSFIAFFVAAMFYEKTMLSQQMKIVSEEADYDPHTGLLNRRGFFKRFDVAVQSPQYKEKKAFLITFDLDDFKMINDQFGHDVGDKVLARVANTLKKNVRADDLVARFGGEEFLVLLIGREVTNVSNIVEKLLEEIKMVQWGDILQGRKVTASAGAVPIEDIEDLHQFIVKADHLLYRAKAKGKDRVEMFSSGSS